MAAKQIAWPALWIFEPINHGVLGLQSFDGDCCVYHLSHSVAQLIHPNY